MGLYSNAQRRANEDLALRITSLSLASLMVLGTVGKLQKIDAKERSLTNKQSIETKDIIETNNIGYFYHILEENETVNTIMKNCNVSIWELLDINGSSMFEKNFNIKIPIKSIQEYTTYTVVEGDSLWAIAQKYNTFYEEIKIINSMTSNNIIPGMIIKVPINLNIVKDNQDKELNINTKVNSDNNKTKYQGIDVSYCQGEVNWEKTKDYIDYAMIRVCDFSVKDDNGNQLLDTQFKRNMEECNRLNIPVGVYCYTRATTVNEAIEEAYYVLNAIKDYKVEYPIYFDIESKSHEKMIDNNLSLVISITEAFCKTIENNGYYVGIYSGDYLINKLTQNSKLLQEYDKWIARYGANEPAFITDVTEKKLAYDGTYNMHQATSRANVPGINGDVDVDFSYVNFQNIIKNAGLNNLNEKSR